MDRGSRFYLGAALVGLFASVVGFFLTYTRPVLSGSYSGPWWGHIHGALAMAWIGLAIAQSWLAPRKPSLHRTLGLLAIGVIPLWFASTVAIAREAAAMAIAAGDIETARNNFGGAISSPLVVLLTIGLALHFRRQPQAHKRLMFLGTVLMLWPSWSRWRHYFPEPEALAQFFAFYVAMAPIPLAMLRDRVRFGAVHPALLWGGLAILAEQALEVALYGTSAWNDFSRAAFRILM